MTLDGYRRTMRGLMRQITEDADASLRRLIALYRAEPRKFGYQAVRVLGQRADEAARAATDPGYPNELRPYARRASDISRRAAEALGSYLDAAS